jgi:hypothetical protein
MARAYDLELELRGQAPRVWRRVRVPADLTLADLHRVIQIVMHWEDVHPHVFDVGGREYGPEPDEEEVSLHWAGDDAEITIQKAVKKERAFEYTYDFGSEHRVEIKLVAEISSGRPQIECLDGGGADFAIGDANARLADGFRRGRVVGSAPVSPETQLVADLTLVLLFLGSWEEGKGARAASKMMRFETLDALAAAGLVVTNTHRTSVDLTADGIKRAEALLQRVVEILRT